jgi:hypothetical protein
MLRFVRLLLAAAVLAGTAASVCAQDDVGRRLQDLNEQIRRLESKVERSAGPAVGLLFGAFCALWAQNTKRNPWLWFFLGLFFNVITVLVLLAKNADDQRLARGERVRGAAPIAVAIIAGIVILLLLASFAFWFTW